MRITYTGDEDAAAWDAYVEPRTATVTDLAAWRRVVREAYGLVGHALVATDSGSMVGSLALFEIKHPIFGHYLTTAPFGNDGGLHFSTDAARDALVEEA